MHSARRATVLVVLLLACFAAAVAARDADAGADTLVVDRADDSLTTACTSAANDCTFRGAMNRAYTTPASVARIEFRIPLAGTQIITTLTPLDVIGGPLEIDGTTQAEVDASCTVDEDGQPCIVLDGAGQGNHGIIGGTGSELTIRGLSIIRFGRAIWFPAGGNHVVVGNYLGTLDGSNFSLANGNETGVYVDTGIHDVRIGGPTALERNVISANDYGIVTNEGDLNIVVQGNYIGTTADGSTALGNRGAGVTFYKTTESLIGGDAAGEGNVISANGFTLDSSGILILNSTDIDVQGNLIGTNAAGTAALGNKTAGVVVAAGSIRTTIGGSGSAGNLISGNASSGIRLDSAGDDSFVRGNRIGTNVAGNAAIPNMGSGVVILNIPGADIGGHLPENGNLISGNGSDGIEIGGLNQGIFIYRNYIGVTADGESALGNADYGISEFATGTATDTTDIVDNVISANGVDGIHLFVSNLIFGSDLTNQVIAGNMVGTDASGSDPLHNGRDAIAIQGVAGAGIYSNTISVADGNRGIFLSSATGSFVQQNYVGTNAAGDDLNGGSVGIKVAQGANNHIGGLSLNPTAMGLGAGGGGQYDPQRGHLRSTHRGPWIGGQHDQRQLDQRQRQPRDIPIEFREWAGTGPCAGFGGSRKHARDGLSAEHAEPDVYDRVLLQSRLR